MFSDNLALALLNICDDREFTYETASELCDISVRHFGDIVRRKTAISVGVLEKICIGLDVTPNDLLLPKHYSPINRDVAMKVVSTQKINTSLGCENYSVCPNCNLPVEREYQNFCENCGQRLSWRKYTSLIK